MFTNKHYSALAAGLTLTLGIISAASADIARVVNGQGDTMTFEYEGSDLRIGASSYDKDGYMLVRDGKMYAVANNNGQPMVFELGSALGLFGQMAGSATPGNIDSKVLSLTDTGRRETVAGMQGQVYELRYEQEGSARLAEIVLSANPLAIAFRDVVFNVAEAVADSMDTTQYQSQVAAGEKLQAQLTALNMGVLRYGKDMKVESIEDTTVDARRFALPAEPTDLGSVMSGIMEAMNQGGASQEGGSDTSSAGEVGRAVGEAIGNIFNKQQ
ncbi:MAG: hypothetical protein ACK5HY_04140 [Parahaliea sp.]